MKYFPVCHLDQLTMNYHSERISNLRSILCSVLVFFSLVIGDKGKLLCFVALNVLCKCNEEHVVPVDKGQWNLEIH